MALSAQDIQKIYLADLGRPADPAGLTYWQGKEDLSQVVDGFAQSDEYKSLHASQDTTHLVTAIYQNLFGRVPETAALANWLKEIDSGQIKANQLGLAIADSAQGTDATVLQAKLDAAQDFTGYLSAVAKMVGSAPMDLTAVRDAWADIKTSADVPSDFSTLIQNHVSLDDLVQKVYVAYFGRPADTAGLDYWVTKAIDTNGDWAGIAAAFASSAEAKAFYDASSDSAFITAVYQNLYGRAPEEGGLKYWTDQLTEGKITRDMLPLAIANGAQESDLTTEQQRLTAADEFTQELQTTKHTADYDGSTTTAAAREWLSGIGPDKTDLDAAKSSLSTLISSFDHGKVQGKAVDSYVKGATVYIDSNGNGRLDTGETSVTTDDGGKFVLPANAPSGILILEGGTDIGTGQPNTAVLKAPVGATVVSPITTLVQQMVESGAADSAENAHDQLFASLGIPQVALSVFDPIQQALSGDDAVKAAAVTLESKAVQIANVLTVAGAALIGAGVSAADAQTSVLQALANNIAKGTTDLTNTDTVQAILQAAVTAAAVPADKQAALTQASADVAKVIASSNDLTENAATAYTEGTVTDAVTALSDVFKVATLVQTDIAPKVQEAAPTGDVQTVVDDYTGDNLTTNLASVTPGEITPDVPANEGSSVTGGGETGGGGGEGGGGGGGGEGGGGDTIAPTQAVTITGVTDDVGTVTGDVVNDGVTDDNKPTICGMLSAALGDGESVAIYNGTTKLGTATATTTDGTTTWTFTPTKGLAQGDYSITAVVEDAAGNQGTASKARTFKIDKTEPTLQDATVNVEGTVYTVVLTYNEALDAQHGPAASDFVVKVNGTVVNLDATSPVSVSGNTVMLTLATAVTSTDTVTVSYKDPTAGNDTNAIQDPAGNDVDSHTIIIGTDNADTLTGTNGKDFIFGGGNDTIDGGDGYDDTLIVKGNISATDDKDIVNVEKIDWYGVAGQDTVADFSGQSENLIVDVYVSTGKDVIKLSDNDDTIYTSGTFTPGDAIIDASQDDFDMLYFTGDTTATDDGGIVNIEEIVWYGVAGSNTTADFSGQSENLIVDVYVSTGKDVIKLGDGDDQIDLGNPGDFASGTDVIDGGDGNDTLMVVGNISATDDKGIVNVEEIVWYGSAKGQNTVADFSGQSENFKVEVIVYTGKDTIKLGTGDDDISLRKPADFASGTDVIDGGGGTDTLHIYYRDQHLTATDDSDLINIEKIQLDGYGSSVNLGSNTEGFTIIGSDYADTIIGGAGADSINGGEDNDIIYSGGGADTIDGGVGEDQIYISGSGAVSIDGGASRDFIYTAENLTLETLTLGTLRAETIIVDASKVTGQVTIGTIDLEHNTGSGGLVGKMSMPAIDGTVEFTGSATAANRVYISAETAATVTGGAAADVFMFGAGENGPAEKYTVHYTITGNGGNDQFLIDHHTPLNGHAIVTIKDFAAGDTTNIYFGTLGDFTGKADDAFILIRDNARSLDITVPESDTSSSITLLDLNGDTATGGNVAFTYGGNTYAVVGPSVAAATTTTNDSTFDNHEILIQLVGNFNTPEGITALQAAFPGLTG